MAVREMRALVSRPVKRGPNQRIKKFIEACEKYAAA
jgi:hypothetical protein